MSGTIHVFIVIQGSTLQHSILITQERKTIMHNIICYTTYLPEGTEQNISFLELLLDENLSNGKIVCPEEVYSEVGDINHKLTAKKNYEFLLRATKKYPLRAIGVSPKFTYDSSAQFILPPPHKQIAILGMAIALTVIF